MNEAVMISIQPKWVEKIVNGKKTIEVRKTKPKLETPFKCYIYCTKTKSKARYCCYEGAYSDSKGDLVMAQGKVIGEFVCDKIYDITPHNDGYGTNQYICGWEYGKDEHCLDFKELNNYLKDKNGYGWHISNLKIYDKPKELSEFKLPCSSKQCASYCKDLEFDGSGTLTCINRNKRFMKRPPQSWCYIEGE